MMAAGTSIKDELLHTHSMLPSILHDLRFVRAHSAFVTLDVSAGVSASVSLLLLFVVSIIRICTDQYVDGITVRTTSSGIYCTY
jgi:ABC-type uncharacterized transport system permease subunit